MATTNMTTTLRFMDALILPNPNAGEFNVRVLTNTMMPNGESYPMADYSVRIFFDPTLHLASTESAFYFFSTGLNRYFYLDAYSVDVIAQCLTNFALNCRARHGDRCGISISTVLESVYLMRRSQPPPPPVEHSLPDYELEETDTIGISSEPELEEALFEFVMGEETDTIGISSEPEADFSTLQTEAYNGGEKKEECCPVCLVEYKEGAHITTLPCSHRFHNPCILTWLRQNRTCPMCRSTVPSIQCPLKD